jgi:hypothetical protein
LKAQELIKDASVRDPKIVLNLCKDIQCIQDIIAGRFQQWDGLKGIIAANTEG